MKRFGSVYIIKNKITGKAYIGQTVNSVSRRFKAHKLAGSSCTALKNAIKKYDKDNFVVEELFIAFSKNELDRVEKLLIEKFGTFVPNGYNLTIGGQGKTTDKAKVGIKISRKLKGNKNHLGKKATYEDRILFSTVQKMNPVIGLNLLTGQTYYFKYLFLCESYNFSRSKVCRSAKASQTNKLSIHKNCIFWYMSDYANQSGSLDLKKSKHAQRLRLDPALKAE